MKRILISILVLTLYGCKENLDKLKKTEEIITVYDKNNIGKFSIKATLGSEKSELIVTLDHEPYQAYYTNALYEIILNLYKNNLNYTNYIIKDTKGSIIWKVEDSKITEITKTINYSKKLMKLLDKKKYSEFLSFSNFRALGVSDSTFIKTIEQNPVYPNTEYKGFSVLEKKINGKSRELMYFFFMNDKRQENMIVIDPSDQLVYGLEF